MKLKELLYVTTIYILILYPCLTEGNFDPTEQCVKKPCPAGKRYHCLVDENWRQGETCLDNLMVTAGMCPYYNTYRGNLDVRPCQVERDINACPKINYQSYKGEQYSGCMMDYSNMDAASVITTSDYTTMSGTTTAPMMTSPQTPTTEISYTSKTAKSEANKADNEMELPSATPQIIAIIVVCIIIVLALIVIYLLYRKYPRFRRFVKGKDHKGQPTLPDEENAAGQDEATSTDRTALLQEIPERDIQSQHGTVSVTREESSSEADNLLHTGNADTDTFHLAPEYVPPNPRDSQSYSEDHRNDTERNPSHSISGCPTTEKNRDEEHNDSDSNVSGQSETYTSCNNLSAHVEGKDVSPNDEVQNEDDITQEPRGSDNEHLRSNDPITNEINTIEAKDSSKSIEPKPEESDSEPKPEETDSGPKPEETDSEPKPEEIDSLTSKDSNGSSSYNKTSEGDKMNSEIKPTVNVSSSHEDKDKTQITSSSTQNDTEEIPNTSSSSAVDDQHELSSTQSSAEVNSKSSSRSSNSSVENSYDVQNSTNDNNIIDSNDIDNRKGEIALVKSHSDEDGIRKENENEASEEKFAELMKFKSNRNQHTEYDLPKGVSSDAVSVDGKGAKFEDYENRVNEAEKEADMSDKQSTVLENGNDSLRKETDNSKTINAIGVYALNHEVSTKDEFQKDSMSPIESKDGDKDSPIKNEVDNETRDVSPLHGNNDSPNERQKTVEKGTIDSTKL